MFSLKHLNVLFLAVMLLWQQHWAAGNHLTNRLHNSQRGRFKTVDNEPRNSRIGPTGLECKSPSCYRYYNNQTIPYFIESLPEVDWNIGEFYSGSVPINSSDPSRTLFFVFKPAMSAPVDEVTVYLNGGPGCSSLEAFFQENGPVLWPPGAFRPRRNPYTWANMTNMLWVEYPVGAGFTQGKVEPLGQIGISKDFLGFFKNWEDLFGIKDYKIYMTGESVAGAFVPYIGAAMLDQNDTTYFGLSGALVYDPCIGDCGFTQSWVPSVQYMTVNQNILNIPQSILSEMQDLALKCGWTQYLDKYLTFPPPGYQPVTKTELSKECNHLRDLSNVIEEVNPCYNPYHITDSCPYVSDPLQLNYEPYFNRTDVKKAMHAPLDVNWLECTPLSPNVYGRIDNSPEAISGPLPKIIEATNRVVVGNGDWDGGLLTNGTLLAIQNMTWNGKLGFQSAPSLPLYVPIGSPRTDWTWPSAHQGFMGRQHYERGLLFVETYQCGHMQPMYQPRATLMHLMWLLGRIDSIPSGP